MWADKVIAKQLASAASGLDGPAHHLTCRHLWSRLLHRWSSRIRPHRFSIFQACPLKLFSRRIFTFRGAMSGANKLPPHTFKGRNEGGYRVLFFVFNEFQQFSQNPVTFFIHIALRKAILLCQLNIAFSFLVILLE